MLIYFRTNYKLIKIIVIFLYLGTVNGFAKSLFCSNFLLQMIKFYVPKTFLKKHKMQIILDRKNWPRLISEMNTFSAHKLAASGYALPHIISWPKFVSMNGSSNVIMPIHFEGYLLSSFWVSNDHFLNENENEREWSLWSLIIK